MKRFVSRTPGLFPRLVAAGLCLTHLTVPVRAQLPAPTKTEAQAAESKYKIEILSAAGKPQRRRNMISSESVIRVTDQNDTPVAGIAVMFSLTNLTGGSAAFANGALSTIVTTNAAGLASTGAVTAASTSSFSISVAASVSGQALTATIPVNMAAVAAGGAAGGGGSGAASGAAGAGTGGGISGAVIGVVAAAGVAAAVVAAKALGGGGDDPTPPPPNARIRIGGPGTPSVVGPR
jgi:hypothetical protein